MMQALDRKPFDAITPILLVEDNAAHAELLTRNLERCVSVDAIHCVRDGEMALNYLFRRGEYADPETSPRPKLILLDLHLPKIDGLEVLRAIRACEELESVPVFIVTTSSAAKDVNEAQAGLADRFLVKPLSPESFRMALEDIGMIAGLAGRPAINPAGA